MLFRAFGGLCRPCRGNDLVEVAAVGGFAVPVFELDLFQVGFSETDEGGYLERDPFEGAVAAESSGGCGIRPVERFEMFVSERMDCEGGHGVVGSSEIYLGDRV